jgi:hypothetical protein
LVTVRSLLSGSDGDDSRDLSVVEGSGSRGEVAGIRVGVTSGGAHNDSSNSCSIGGVVDGKVSTSSERHASDGFDGWVGLVLFSDPFNGFHDTTP